MTVIMRLDCHFHPIHLEETHLLTGDILQVLLHHDLSEAHLYQPLCALPLRGPITQSPNFCLKTLLATENYLNSINNDSSVH